MTIGASVAFYPAWPPLARGGDLLCHIQSLQLAVEEDDIVRPLTVAELANRADLDLDDALVTLWDIGITNVNDPEDVIPHRQVKTAQSALGIENPRRQVRIDYWLKRTGMSRDAFAKELAAIGVQIRPNAKTLPKGVLRRVRKRFEFQPPIEPAPPAPKTPGSSPPDTPIPPFEWHDIGSRRDVTFLEEQDLLEIHHALVNDFAQCEDPISPPGVKSPELVSSAVFRPQTSHGHAYKYPTVEMAAAALLHSVVNNHAFHNGNKRTALVAMLAFLDRNNVIATCDQDELFRFTLRVAQHGLVPLHFDQYADREVSKIAEWIKDNSRRVERGERRIPWHQLKRILRKFDCEYEPANKGGMLNIHRTIDARSALGIKRTKTLNTSVAWRYDGSEVSRSTVNKIRNELRLDEKNGFDSHVFYGDGAEPDDFIQQYRTVLRRLAKL